MTINPEILSIFEEYKIYKDDGICYLLSMYYGYNPTLSPSIKQKVNATGIIQSDNNNIIWKIPLFQGQQTAWDWVKFEYVPLFKKVNPQRGGKVREATARMKELFRNNPEIRKEDVIEATKMYLQNTDYRYIRFPHFFIQKDKGVNKTQDILDWIDNYKNSRKFTVSNDITNQLQ